MAKTFRSLSKEEVSKLIRHGCSCQDWSAIKVAEKFEPSQIKTTHFSGNVKLGKFNNQVNLNAGIVRQAGIANATIHNCSIGDNVYINQVGNAIANYVIEDNVIIENLGSLTVEGESSFGNGTKVKVLNEMGGREVPIYNRLSAHMAYIIAFYRHKTKVTENILKMIDSYAKNVCSSMGLIQTGSKLINCRIIKNVNIGQNTTIEGADKLENGSINSCRQDPVYIGPAVIAEDFIVCSGSNISDGTIIYKCFVGQGTILSKQYSADNSLFFANCVGFHGEACSVFAGPYTVTHHKSTLLIAGLYSFLNAGSGCNQSNHMYKLGAVHQGIVERGSKTGSDSYILWPAKVGAFTVVMGRHYKNSDTSELPFSYMVEHRDESILIPGINLQNVGTIRDASKWPKRDRRKNPEKLDYINFKLLSPYTGQKMVRGIELLKKLKADSDEKTKSFNYHNVKIKSSSLKHGIEFYKMGIDKFLGNCLIRRMEDKQPQNVQQFNEALLPKTKIGNGKWIDMAGLFAPESIIKELLENIENKNIDSLKEIEKVFKSIHSNYREYEWVWAITILQSRLGKIVNKISQNDIIKLIKQWKTTVVKLDRMLYGDAKKEFAATAQIGFGLDGNEEIKHADFNAVRGTFEKNDFVLEIEEHITEKTKLGDKIIGLLEKIN